MRLNFRQGIIRQSTGYINPTASGVNLLIANNTPLEVTIAHKTKNYFHTEAADVVNAWDLRPADVAGGNTAWLYIDLNVITGVRTFGYTRTDMIVSTTQPVSPADGQHWFDESSTTMKVYSTATGGFIEVVRIFLATYVDGAVTTYGVVGTSQVDISTLTPTFGAGSIIYDNTGTAVKTAAGTFLTTESDFYSSGNVVNSTRLESDVIYAKAAENLPAYAIVKYSAYGNSSFGEISLASYDDTDTTVLAVTTYALSAGEIGTVITAGNITNDLWDWEGGAVEIGAKLYVGINANAGTLVASDPADSDPLLEKKAHVARVIGKNKVQFSHTYALSTIQGTGGTGGTSDPATASTLGLVRLYQDDATDPANPRVVTIETLADELAALSFDFTAVEIQTDTISASPESPPFSPEIVQSNVQAVLQLLNLNKFDKTGGDISGNVNFGGTVTLNADPVSNLQAATKQYVDTEITTATSGVYLPLSGGTLTGVLTLNADPVSNLQAATKQYVDNNTFTNIWNEVNVDTLAVANQGYIVDSSGAIVTITLPVGPNVNDTVRISDYNGSAALNAIIIDGGAENIMGFAEDFELNSANATLELVYVSVAHGWKIVDGIGETGPSSVGTITHWTFVDSASTIAVAAAVSTGYVIDTTTAVVTLTLPLSPQEGDIVTIAPGAPTWATNAVIVEGNGNDINNQALDVTFNTVATSYDLTFISPTFGWLITQHKSDIIINTDPYVITIDDGTGSAFTVPTQTGGNSYLYRIINLPAANTFIQINAGTIRATKSEFAHVGAGNVTLVAGAGVTINSKGSLAIDGFGSKVTLIKVSDTVYDLYGDVI